MCVQSGEKGQCEQMGNTICISIQEAPGELSNAANVTLTLIRLSLSAKRRAGDFGKLGKAALEAQIDQSSKLLVSCNQKGDTL